MNAITKFVHDNGRTPTEAEVADMMKEVARADVQAFRKRWGSQIVHPEDHKKKSVEGKHVKAERHATIIRMTKEGCLFERLHCRSIHNKYGKYRFA